MTARRTSRRPRRRTSRNGGPRKLGSGNRELQEVVEKALRAGWNVGHTRNGHLRFVSPDKSVPPIFMGGTPSDSRSVKNLRAHLKRYGLLANVARRLVSNDMYSPYDAERGDEGSESGLYLGKSYVLDYNDMRDSWDAWWGDRLVGEDLPGRIEAMDAVKVAASGLRANAYDIEREIALAVVAGEPRSGRRAAALIGSSADPKGSLRAVMQHVPKSSRAYVTNEIKKGFDEVAGLRKKLWQSLVRGVDETRDDEDMAINPRHKQREVESGRYQLHLDTPCVCGHTLGEHTHRSHVCVVEGCECNRFRKAKKSSS